MCTERDANIKLVMTRRTVKIHINNCNIYKIGSGK